MLVLDNYVIVISLDEAQVNEDDDNDDGDNDAPDQALIPRSLACVFHL